MGFLQDSQADALMAWTRLVDPNNRELQGLRRAFGTKAHFLIDENLGEGSAEFVRSRGYKAIWAGDVNLTGKADKNLFAYAWRRKLFLITHDHDFLDDRRFPFSRNPGVIVVPGANGGDRSLIRALVDVCSVVGGWRVLWEGSKIEIYEDETWRVRQFQKHIGRHTTELFKWDKHGRSYSQEL